MTIPRERSPRTFPGRSRVYETLASLNCRTRANRADATRASAPRPQHPMNSSDALLSFRHLLERTPVRTFLIYPICVIAFELAIRRGNLVIVPWGALLLAWGYLQYRLTGQCRVQHGGGGPGITVPPEHLVED